MLPNSGVSQPRMRHLFSELLLARQARQLQVMVSPLYVRPYLWGGLFCPPPTRSKKSAAGLNFSTGWEEGISVEFPSSFFVEFMLCCQHTVPGLASGPGGIQEVPF